MGARIIDGNKYSGELQCGLAREVAELLECGARPGLATLLAGSQEAVDSYERRARRLAEHLGYHYRCERLAHDADEAEVIATVEELNADPDISGILILRPLPEGVSEAAVYSALAPSKDIEAQHPENAGLLALGRPRYEPSTAASCFYLLDRYLADSGREPAEFYRKSTVTLVGRSDTVGKPAVSLGFARGATVISCDKNASDSGRLAEYTGQAEVLIVAAGVPSLIKREHVREGAIVLDVGTNPVTDPGTGEVRLVGDVDLASVASKAEAVSPVPGGVGAVTYTKLLVNVAEAARNQLVTSGVFEK